MLQYRFRQVGLTVVVALSAVGPAMALDRTPKATPSKPPRADRDAGSSDTLALTCLPLCLKQRQGKRMDESERKAFQDCFDQALCPTVFGPPVVREQPYHPPGSPLDMFRAPYGAFPDGRV